MYQKRGTRGMRVMGDTGILLRHGGKRRTHRTTQKTFVVPTNWDIGVQLAQALSVNWRRGRLEQEICLWGFPAKYQQELMIEHEIGGKNVYAENAYFQMGASVCVNRRKKQMRQQTG